MSPTQPTDPEPDPRQRHEGLQGKVTDAMDTVKKRIHDYHEGPHDLD